MHKQRTQHTNTAVVHLLQVCLADIMKEDGEKTEETFKQEFGAEKVFFKQADITVKDNLKGKWFPFGTAWLKEKDNFHTSAEWKGKLRIFRIGYISISHS